MIFYFAMRFERAESHTRNRYMRAVIDGELFAFAGFGAVVVELLFPAGAGNTVLLDLGDGDEIAGNVHEGHTGGCVQELDVLQRAHLQDLKIFGRVQVRLVLRLLRESYRNREEIR